MRGQRFVTPIAVAATAPTAGLRQYTDTHAVQHSYNLPQADRFSVTSGPEYNAWIDKGDKPFTQGSGTGPRTEMRWHTNWNENEHQWQGDVLIDPGTNGACTHYSAPPARSGTSRTVFTTPREPRQRRTSPTSPSGRNNLIGEVNVARKQGLGDHRRGPARVAHRDGRELGEPTGR